MKYPDANWFPGAVTLTQITKYAQNDIDVRKWKCLCLPLPKHKEAAYCIVCLSVSLISYVAQVK